MNPRSSDDATALARTLTRLDGRINRERMRRRGPWRVTLDPVRDLLERLGRPQASAPAVHVAGSKGKGSVAALIATALQRSGARPLLYTSPHVERLNERIRIAGECVDDDLLRCALDAAMDAQDAAGSSPAAEASWFDLVTAAAFWMAREVAADWIVAECGLGGRLDSTNVLLPRLCVITAIELEHTTILGNTRAAIAAEKAGILKPEVPLVCGLPEEDDAGRVIAARARELGCPLHRPPGLESGRSGQAPPGFQERNVALARTSLEILGLGHEALDEETQRRARLPAREELFRFRGVPVLLDGAHVAASVAALLAYWRRQPGFDSTPITVLGTARDKDLPAMLKALEGQADRLICTSVGGDLHRAPDEIARAAAGFPAVVETVPPPVEALERAVQLAQAAPNPAWVLVIGSLHLAGAVRSTLAAAVDAAC